MTTIKDVAQLAGVSTATVSKVINGSYSISEATSQRVFAAMKQLQYAPNRRAQNFARQFSGNITFVAGLKRDEAFNNPHMFEIMSGVLSSIGRKDYTLTVANVEQGDWSALKQLISEKGTDGLILHAGVVTTELSQMITDTDFPHIVIGMPNFRNRLCWIDNNNLLSGELAASHLLETGKKRIAMIGGGDNDAISETRLTGAIRSLRSCYPVQDSYILRGNVTVEDAQKATERLLSLSPRPNAIICANNLLSLGCLRTLRDRHIKIPREIAVITFDNYPYAAITEPPLTVVNIDMFDLGWQAGRLIMSKIRQPSLQMQTYITLPQIIVRESTVLKPKAEQRSL